MPLDETLESYARLLEQGKVRAIGASNLGAARLQQALDVSANQALPRYLTLQPLYNLYDRDIFEGPLAQICIHEGIAALDRVATRIAATPVQVSLAWLMARPGVTAPIASATSVAQLGELIAATRLTLDADAIRALDAASA